MRRIALYSDVHANLPALRAVYADMDSAGIVERYCLGDLVGYGPHPREVVALVRKTGDRVVQGNYDRAIGGHLADGGSFFQTPQEKLDGAESYARTIATVTDDDVAYLAELDREVRLDVGAARLVLCHASPQRTTRLVLPDVSARVIASLARAAGADVVCSGHSHVPFHRCVQAVQGVYHWVSAGSVGRPRDGDPRAAWVEVVIGARDEVLASAPQDLACRRIGRTDLWLAVQVHRVAYDVDSVVSDMTALGLPITLSEALRSGSEERERVAPSGSTQQAESAPALLVAQSADGTAPGKTLAGADAVGAACTCPVRDRIISYESLASLFRDGPREAAIAIRRLRNAMRACEGERRRDAAGLASAFVAADVALRSNAGREAFLAERRRLLGTCRGFDPFSHVLSPSELTYLADEESDRAADLEARYRRHGFEVPVCEEGPCSPGHIAVELEFVAHCLRRFADGNEREEDCGGAFFAEHLAQWALLFAVVVAQQAREPVMAYAGRALDAHLLYEAAIFRAAVPARCAVRADGRSEAAPHDRAEQPEVTT